MPRTFGDGLIHSSHIDIMVNCDEKLHERPAGKMNEIDRKIGQIIADNLIEDQATLQMGAIEYSYIVLPPSQVSAPFPTLRCRR